MEQESNLIKFINPLKIKFISVAEAQAGLARELASLPDDEWVIIIMKNNKPIGFFKKWPKQELNPSA